MALSENDRFSLWGELMREASSMGAGFGLVKADLRAAVNGVDDGMDAAGSTINQWFPQPARAALNVRQKAFIVGYVALRRALRS